MREYKNTPDSVFWLDVDYSGGDNLRDPGTVPFWMLPQRPHKPPPEPKAIPVAPPLPPAPVAAPTPVYNPPTRRTTITYATKEKPWKCSRCDSKSTITVDSLSTEYSPKHRKNVTKASIWCNVCCHRSHMLADI